MRGAVLKLILICLYTIEKPLKGFFSIDKNCKIINNEKKGGLASGENNIKIPQKLSYMV